MSPPLILASTSPFRRMLMENAGLSFSAVGADIDERAIGDPLEAAGVAPETLALALAEAKALAVSSLSPGSMVIGSDQTLSLGAIVYHKPAHKGEAKRHLQSFSGKTHQLNSAVVIASNDRIVWRHVSSARLTMRALSDAFIDRYLERVGERVSASVGAYQLEGEGIQLFEAIDGDYFTILGLPMLPLLGQLRKLGLIDA